MTLHSINTFIFRKIAIQSILTFALVWVELAVGVFGTPWAGS